MQEMTITLGNTDFDVKFNVEKEKCEDNGLSIGAYLQDIQVFFDEKEITEFLNENTLENLEDKILEKL